MKYLVVRLKVISWEEKDKDFEGYILFKLHHKLMYRLRQGITEFQNSLFKLVIFDLKGRTSNHSDIQVYKDFEESGSDNQVYAIVDDRIKNKFANSVTLDKVANGETSVLIFDYEELFFNEEEEMEFDKNALASYNEVLINQEEKRVSLVLSTGDFNDDGKGISFNLIEFISWLDQINDDARQQKLL